MAELKVACVTMRSGVEVGPNIEAATQLIRQAAAGGAQLIATPEMTSLLDRKPGAVWAKSTSEAADPALQAFRLLRLENSARFGVEDEPQRTAKFAPGGRADEGLGRLARRVLIARYEFVCFFLLIK